MEEADSRIPCSKDERERKRESQSPAYDLHMTNIPDTKTTMPSDKLSRGWWSLHLDHCILYFGP